EIEVLQSTHACKKRYEINPGMIFMCCKGVKSVKRCYSKKTKEPYKFEYTDDPITVIVEHKRFRKTLEDIGRKQREYRQKFYEKNKDKLRMYQIERRIKKQKEK